MKTAIIITDGAKQIMFTPETEMEKEALKLITAEDNIDVHIKRGGFHSKGSVAGYSIDMCQGGYLRAWDSSDSVMLVLTPKKEQCQP